MLVDLLFKNRIYDILKKKFNKRDTNEIYRK